MYNKQTQRRRIRICLVFFLACTLCFLNKKIEDNKIPTRMAIAVSIEAVGSKRALNLEDGSETEALIRCMYYYQLN